MTTNGNNKTNGKKMIPPEQFAQVETGIFRSAYPTEANIPFLLRTGIKTIALLSIEALPVSVVRALADTTNTADANTTTTSSSATAAGAKATANNTRSMSTIAVESRVSSAANQGSSSLLDKNKGNVVSPLLSPKSKTASSSGASTVAPAGVRGSGADNSKSAAAKEQKGIRVVEVADLRSWKNDAANGHDDFSQRDIQRALDLAVNARWHPILFCCPTGELQTSVVVGCMRRYQLWPLSSIYSECELFLSMCKTVRQSVLYFISIWNPKDYPITITDVKFRNKKWNMMERMEAMKRKDPRVLFRRSSSARSFAAAKNTLRARQQERSAASIDGGTTSSSRSSSQSSNSETSDHSTTPTTTDHTQSDLYARTPTYDRSGKFIDPRVASPDSGTERHFPSGEKASPSSKVKKSASAAALASASALHRRPRVPGASHNGVKLATWIVRALQLERDLDAYVADMHDKAFRQNMQAAASFPTSAETAAHDALPPPHVRFAGMEKPPSLDARSTFTKESIIDEDD